MELVREGKNIDFRDPILTWKLSIKLDSWGFFTWKPDRESPLFPEYNQYGVTLQWMTSFTLKAEQN